MKRFSATQKGFVTGLLILLVSAVTFWLKGNFENTVVLIAYFIYAAGIAWQMLSFHQENKEATFRQYFQQGFKTFIIVTLIMVCATWLFLKFNNGMIESMVNNQRDLLKQDKNIAAAEIESHLATYRKFILPGYTMAAVLSYLGIGTLISFLLGIFLTMKQQKR